MNGSKIIDSQMDDAAREMARRYYGYGRWDAPYWFIGPEQGQSRSENNDLKLRHEAWLDSDADGLNDCRAFHQFMNRRAGPEQRTQWHRENLPALQPTWRRLMLLLMTLLERPADNQSLRIYQRDQWGNRSGETCVIELSGLPANSFRVARDRKSFRQERIEFIYRKMLVEKPAFAVVYGKSQMKHWEPVVGIELHSDDVLKVGSTFIAFAPQPTAPGQTDRYWTQLGLKIASAFKLTRRLH